MNICKMNGFAKTLRICKRDLLSGLVEPVAFAIVRINVAINPAVPMKVRKLCGLQLFVEIRAASLFQKFLVAPESACGRGFWISQRSLVALFFRGIFLLRWISFGRRFRYSPGDAKMGGSIFCPDAYGRPCTGWRESGV
jgi:hypothetical protein